MFEFVNEVIINSATDAYSGLNKFSDYQSGKGFRVFRVGDYLAENVKGKVVYKTSPSDPQKSISEITIPSSIIPSTAGDVNHICLYLRIRLSGSVNSYYANLATDRKTRDFRANVDVISTDTVQSVAEKIVNVIKGQALDYDNVRFNVAIAGAKITITSENEFQLFDKLQLLKLVDWNVAAVGNYYPKEPVYTLILDGTKTQIAKEGVGTYKTMLANTQIQTSLRTGIFNQDNDDTKIQIGAKYVQYVFDYECDRDFTGMGAVGQKLTSITKAVFWINSAIATQFETVVKASGVAVDDLGSASDNPGDDGSAQGATVTMALGVGKTKSVNIKLSEYDEVSSSDIAKATVEGAQITGVAAGSANVVYKKAGSTVLTVTVTVS